MTVITLPSRTVDTDNRFEDNMSRQEVFDQIVYHLGTMEERSAKQSCGMLRVYCLYRHPSGNSCALGRMIKDSEYLSEMERKSAWSLINTYPTIKVRLLPHEGLITSLQQVHDEDRNWTDNRARMKEQLIFLVHSFRIELDYEMINHPDMAWNAV